jgi:hypothetical protein
MIKAIPNDWRLPTVALCVIVGVALLALMAGRLNEVRQMADFEFPYGQNVAVVMNFEPERFHIEAFQEVGRYQGWHDGRAVIMSVNDEALGRLARNYWVSAIEALEEQP